MEFKGTKGKWNSCCLKARPHFLFDETGYTTICSFIQKQEISEDLSLEEVRANALLISKAPELLEMLVDVRQALLMTNTDGDLILADAIEKLINEATEI